MRVYLVLAFLALTQTSYALNNNDGTLSLTDGILLGSSSSSVIDSQSFLSGSSTWTKPTDAKFVDIWCVGGGAGGGSGAVKGLTIGGGGGGGGASGALRQSWFNADELESTLTVVIGASASGGAAISTDNTAGAAGTDGNPTYVGGSTCTSTPTPRNCIVYARAGGRGGAGTLTAGGAGGTYPNGQPNGRSGGAGGYTANGAGGSNACQLTFYGSGAGGGGGAGNSLIQFISNITSLNGCQNGTPPQPTPNVTTTASGITGTSFTTGRRLANGGLGGRGGVGGLVWGGNGGGGGLSTSTVFGPSGAGGSGGAGICLITSYK